MVFLVAPEEGTLAAVEGVEEALAVEGVRDVRIYRRPGFELGRFVAAPTAPEPSWRSGTTATTRSRALAVRPTQYASSSNEDA